MKNIFYNFFFVCIKATNNFYQKHKERLKKKGTRKISNLPEEEKGKT